MLKMIVGLTLLLTVIIFSQPVESQVNQQDSESNKVMVYVYKTPHQGTLGRVAPPVYCDEQLLAKLDGGRYFIVKLEPP